MTDLAFVYAPDPAVEGGGADLRVARLLAEVRRYFVARFVEVGTSPSADVRVRITRARRLLAAASGLPPRMSQRFDPLSRGRVEAALDGSRVVVANTIFTLPYVQGRARDRLVVLDAHNVESSVVRQLAETDSSSMRRTIYRRTLGWTRMWEAHAAKSASQVWAVSETEARWFRNAGARDVAVVPNGVHLSGPVWRPAATDVVFVGSLTSPFNRAGLEWFVKRCWPRIRRAVPSARLIVVGAGGESFAADRIEGHGYVADLEGVYQSARLAIVPLLSGAGTRLKILEAMAHGVPVVSTTLGAEGLDLRAGVDLIIADTETEFADACSHLLVDDLEARRLSGAGRQAVERSHTWQLAGRQAAEALARLLP